MTPVIDNRWFVALSPQGAARAVGEQAIKALSQRAEAAAVKVFDCRIYYKAFSNLLAHPDESMIVDLLNHALIVQCLDFRATHILVLSLCPITLFSLNLLKKQGVATIHWFYEDFRQAHYWKEVVAGYDYFFAIQKGPILSACSSNNARYYLLPTAADSNNAFDLPIAFNCSFTADAAFIGIPSPYRIGILEFLAQAGLRLAIAGAGWSRYRGLLEKFIINGEWTDASQSARILSNAPIGLNLSVNDPENDWKNTHISPRVFDILNSGRILVTEDVPLIKETLQDCFFYTFSDQRQALDAITSAISRLESSAGSAMKNREIIRARHTYENRIGEIIAITTGAH